MPHMGFSDEPLILSAGDSVKAHSALEALGLTTIYTRAFFDKVLRGDSATPLDQTARRDTSVVTVEHFAPHR
jgi:hypothetical protein